MRILVAGGGGFIGSHLSKKLLDNNNVVICVDNFLTGAKKNLDELLTNPNFSLIQQDVTLPLMVTEPVDRIYHLASPASPNHHSPISYHALAMETMETNTIGTHNLLKLAEKMRARFLFASTSEVYGDPLVNPQPETYLGNVSTTGPRSVYDEAKRFGETLVSYYVRTKNVDCRIARIFNTYGPKMHKQDMRMVASFISQALQGNPINIFGDGTQTRSLCYVSDTVEGLIRLMEVENGKGLVVNIGNEQEMTVNEFANTIKKLTNSSSELSHHEALPEDDPKLRRPDISKARNLLKWEPVVSLEEGLKLTIEYIKNSAQSTYVTRELGSSDISTAGEISTVTKMDSKPSRDDLGEVSVDTDPQGALVYLDLDEKGIAPLLLADVPKGTHELSVYLPGFFRRTLKINVEPGYRTTTVVKLAIDELTQKESTKSATKITETNESGKAKSTSQGKVRIKDTPTGWLRVRTEPSVSASESAKVNPGETFELLEEQPNWYKILFNDEQEGWVSAEFSEKIQ